MAVMGDYLWRFLVAVICVATGNSQTAPPNDKYVFDLVYQESKQYGLLPTVYYLSTYTSYYTNAEIACQALGGYLVEINSHSELNFIRDFIVDDVTKHEFIHINGFRNNNSGEFVTSTGVDLVAVINEKDGSNSSSSNSSSGSGGSPLYIDFWGNPGDVQNPPACLELDKRRGILRMTSSRCDRSINRYICEKPLST